jgi:hypothetical protein
MCVCLAFVFDVSVCAKLQFKPQFKHDNAANSERIGVLSGDSCQLRCGKILATRCARVLSVEAGSAQVWARTHVANADFQKSWQLSVFVLRPWRQAGLANSDVAKSGDPDPPTGMSRQHGAGPEGQ